MRIGMFTLTYGRSNGVAVSVANLSRALREAGHEVHIFGPSGVADTDEFYHPFVTVRFPQAPDYPVPIPNFLRALKIARRYNLKLMHTHHPWLLGSDAVRVARELEVPVVSTVHTQYDFYSELFPWIPSKWKRKALHWVLRRHLCSVDLVTTPGIGSKARLDDMQLTTPVRLVTNGTDLSLFGYGGANEIRRQLRIPEGAQVFGYVGRFDPEKDLGTLIDAAAKVFKWHPRAVLLMVGDGKERESLEWKSKPLGNRVIFTGRIAHEQIAPYYSAMDIFVTPSRFEVQPMTIAEAFASGLPVVALDVPGSEMVHHGYNGLLVDPAQPVSALARGVSQIFSDPFRHLTLQGHARESARQYETAEALSQMLSAYQDAGYFCRTRQSSV